jgi:predicted DsbA family dithiol-disulfide isomerase
MTLEKILDADTDEVWAIMEGLKNVASEYDLPFGDLTHAYNSRLAQELGAWAESTDRGGLFHNIMFHAYFVEGKNIADSDVLLNLAGKAHLDRDEAQKVIQERLFREVIDEEWALSRKMGIRMAPTFVMNGLRVEGMQPYEVMKGLAEGKEIPLVLKTPPLTL